MRAKLVVWFSSGKVSDRDALATYHDVRSNRDPGVKPHATLDGFESAIQPLFPLRGSVEARSTGIKRVGGVIVVRIEQCRTDGLVSEIEDRVADYGLTCFVHDLIRPWVWQPPYLKLYGCLQTPISCPGEIAIQRTFRNLRPAHESYLILLRRNQRYMQAKLEVLEAESTVSPQYWLEYREDSADRHFRAVTSDADRIENALLSYSRGDENWRAMFQFERLIL